MRTPSHTLTGHFDIVVIHLSFIALFLFVAPAVVAQNGELRGIVRDADGQPLVGANIIVKGTVLGSASDGQGEYAVRRIPPGSYRVVCSMIGYGRHSDTVSIGAGETVRRNFTLRETAIETGEVIVTAGRHAQSLEEIPVSVSIFDSREIEARGIISLDNALRKVSGVNITEDQVNIRGSSGYSRAVGSRVLLLIDGAPVLAGDAGEIKFDVVPMFAVDRIEVVKGAGSALYGSSALGGVINVITRRPQSRIARARLYSGFWDEPHYEEWKWWGDSPRYRSGMDLQYGDAAGDFSYLVTGGLRNDQAYRQNDDYRRWNLNSRAWYRLSPDRNLNVSVNYSNNDRGNWVFWRNLEHALQPPVGADLTERILSTKLQAAAQYRQTHSASFASMLRGSMYRTSFRTTSDTSDFSMRPSDQTQSTAYKFNLEWQGSWTMRPNNLLTFGAEASYATVDSRTFGNRDGVSSAIYAQDEISLGGDWHISAGLRFDLTSIDTLEIESQLNPRVGLTYVPWEGAVARASYGWGFRSPSIGERYATASAGGILTKPNPDLRAERSTSYEIGLKQNFSFGVSLDAAAFLNEYENLVEPKIDAEDQRIVFRNITEARIIGYEISADVRVMPERFAFSLGYTYLYPRDLVLNSILKYRPRHLLYASGNLRFGPVTLGADFRHLSRVENIDREIGLVIPDSDSRVAIYVTDIRLSVTGESLSLPLRLTFFADNIFQYHYTEVIANVAAPRGFRLMLEAAF